MVHSKIIFYLLQDGCNSFVQNCKFHPEGHTRPGAGPSQEEFRGQCLEASSGIPHLQASLQHGEPWRASDSRDSRLMVYFGV